KNVLDLHDYGASFLDWVYETILHKRVSIQLISSTHCDPCMYFNLELRMKSYIQANGSNGKIGKAAFIEDWGTKKSAVAAGEASFSVTFEWDDSMGVPGALLIKNHHRRQFYLKTVELEHVPGHDETIHFVCNSWVYPTHRYSYDRIFFANQYSDLIWMISQAYLPSSTPKPLLPYRNQELINLRGTGSGMLKEWDRVYDYAYYNDLGAPDKGPDYERRVLGGSQEYPYPRRARTGREPTKTDPNSEKRLCLLNLNIYVPRDERFGHIKFSDFSAYAAKSIGQVIRAEIKAVFDRTPNEFDSFDDVMKLYKGSSDVPKQKAKNIRKNINLELLRELLRNDGEKLFKFPMPDVIKDNQSAWRTDEEFGREMVAGVNPVVIRRLEEFPPASKLDPNEYGDQTSSMTEEHIRPNMNGLTVKQALEENKLFILDHHDTLMPYLTKINSTVLKIIKIISIEPKIYATRTVLLLKDDGTLKPLAIELSLPNKDSEIYTPAEDGVEGTIWQLAKAYAAVNDSGYHQLISHWLYQLIYLRDFHNSVMKFVILYRGVAVKDPSQPHGLKLLIEDYPFAIDGLEIWSAIQTWVHDYCSIYYHSDEMVRNDSELESWWTELRTEGHGDKKDEAWWPKMNTRADLIDTCTIIIWVASALHAAVNFGQYPYAGYLPNRPTVSRRFMPEPGTPEYAELESNPEKAFLKTITSQLQTLLGVSLIEILSRHSTDEIYLGQNVSPYWTLDTSALQAFKRFGEKLKDIERGIEERNKDKCLKNRNGLVNVPYTLLYPNISSNGEVGLTSKGIPNSISI
ncbi:hypothetical protein M8C21_020677, partial [Ambrosia artemisiifolia]